MSELPFAYGGPPLSGRMRATAADFEVDEVLGFAADGFGEHAMLRIEKRDANTEWVAQRLAEVAGVAPMSVGYSGLKDRHALTRQTYTVHLPGKSGPDWMSVDIEGVRILEVARHSRKLKRGVHRSNRFLICLRDVVGSKQEAEVRMREISAQGTPNYFGAQRFGRDGDNLRSAQALFSGARVSRSQRGFALSAARSHLFNEVLARRVAAGSWNTALEGEVFMLAGTHSIFGPQTLDAGLLDRLECGDIDPTGPLWGRGVLRSGSEVAAIEREVAAAESVYSAGLAATDLSHERRSLRLAVSDLAHHWADDGSLSVGFSLPSGSFATAVIRELCAT